MTPDIILDQHDKGLLLATAREAILAKLEKRTAVYGDARPAVKAEYGAFVTLRLDGRLRGCIGTLRAQGPLFAAVKEMAISSAFRDPRFPPVTMQEFSSITIEISVLTPLVRTADPESIEVGTHGLYIVSGPYSGVLLPQVPVEQGWNREQFLEGTCRKAGMRPDAWRGANVDLYTFSAVIFSEEQLHSN